MMSVDNLLGLAGRDIASVDAYCTLTRENKHKRMPLPAVAAQRPVLTRRLSGSHDDLYTGTRVSKVPEPMEYAVRVSHGSTSLHRVRTYLNTYLIWIKYIVCTLE